MKKLIKKTVAILAVCTSLPFNCLIASANNCSDTSWKGYTGADLYNGECSRDYSFVVEGNKGSSKGKDRKCSIRRKLDDTSVYVYNKSSKKATVTVNGTHYSPITPGNAATYNDDYKNQFPDLDEIVYVPAKSERLIPQYIKENGWTYAHIHFETKGTYGLWSPDSVGWYPNADIK